MSRFFHRESSLTAAGSVVLAFKLTFLLISVLSVAWKQPNAWQFPTEMEQGHDQAQLDWNHFGRQGSEYGGLHRIKDRRKSDRSLDTGFNTDHVDSEPRTKQHFVDMEAHRSAVENMMRDGKRWALNAANDLSLAQHSGANSASHSGGHKLADEAAPASAEASTTAEESSQPKRRPLSWDKLWWSGGAWALWILSSVLPTVLIFILNGMTQGWACGMIYVAILLPLDIATYYYDIYAYDEGDMFVFELMMATAINCCLCACLIPAYTSMRVQEEETARPPGGYGLPGGGGYGSFGFFPAAQPRTDYGRPSERTQYV